MTEPIEKWREDFESYSDEEFIGKFPSGVYQWKFMEERWNGFLMAKRSQPVIELQKPEKDDHTDVAFYVTKFFEALADAGIQCRTKGD